MPQRKKKSNPQEVSGLTALILVFAVLILLAIGVRLVINAIAGAPAPKQEETVVQQQEEKPSLWERLFGGKQQEETTQPTEPEETTPTVTSSATVAAMGDLLMHIQLISPEYDSIAPQPDGSYDFSPIFEYMTDTVAGYDYTIANLETTFGGSGHPYQGNPAFNCPDSLAATLADTGFDMLLTANNHCADTLTAGIKRTLSVVRDQKLATLGTRLTDQEPRYTIAEINGISIGMVCYTYTMHMVNGVPSLNGGLPLEEPELVNYFTYEDLPGFYAEIGSVYDQMRSAGAEATVLFIHWGEEYILTENTQQNTIAQKMCDLGFDVIVGGHPHVVQPMELLTATNDPQHKTVCIYSLGNAVSNQRLGNLNSIKTAHTEDGVLFSVTFRKLSDGTVFLADTQVMPLWVNMHRETGKLEYNILPLADDTRELWADAFGLNAETLKNAQNSYTRTMDILGSGLQDCQNWLSQTNQRLTNPQSADAA